jgi:hypothetical protein
MLSPSTSALGALPTKSRPSPEGLRQPVRTGLHRVVDTHAPLTTVTQQIAEARRVLRRADQEHVTHVREHQRTQRVVDHRLVVDRGQPRAGAAGEDDAFATHALITTYCCQEYSS